MNKRIASLFIITSFIVAGLVIFQIPAYAEKSESPPAEADLAPAEEENHEDVSDETAMMIIGNLVILHNEMNHVQGFINTYEWSSHNVPQGASPVTPEIINDWRTALKISRAEITKAIQQLIPFTSKDLLDPDPFGQIVRGLAFMGAMTTATIEYENFCSVVAELERTGIDINKLPDICLLKGGDVEEEDEDEQKE